MCIQSNPIISMNANIKWPPVSAVMQEKHFLEVTHTNYVNFIALIVKQILTILKNHKM